ncbi:hypothetical protein GCM10020358_24540 [Amorphoplanes nipponensis]|uniref:Uncharacterized protein n=1 Tax=Actinoplanes nipponensis TaxID=135950 RepID=A0A919JMP2_9ACTN|nr:DUF6223 family protein [Actinoplanes nipponensis]GIE53441.1 hypothetical protein Ani05nite_69750 [Actinoplanes nipponensis]
MRIDDLYAASTVAASTVTADRVIASAAALVALAATIAGGRALSRPAGRGSLVALVAGVTGIVVGGWVIATADGGPGTGNGIVGGYAAVALGLIGAALGGLARTRRLPRA